MECEQDRNMTKQKFNKKICSFKNLYGLYIFYINTLLLIEFDGWRYCFSSQLENDRKCLLCEILIVFSDFEKEMSDNMLNTDFLQNYRSKLYKYLRKLFYVHKSLLCCFLDSEYIQNVRDRSGRIHFVFLSEIIENLEKIKLK